MTDAELGSRGSWGIPFGWWIFIGTVLFAGAGVAAVFFVPAPLLDEWLPDGTAAERAEYLWVAAQVVLFLLGGVIALVGVGLSASRHRQELAAAERDRARLAAAEAGRRDDVERELRSRFVTAVNLLGDDSPVKRIAALYALGALADDWDAFGKPDQVQVCIDTIAAYLRAPLPDGATATTAQEASVKQSGFSVIRAHLQSGAPHSWSQNKVDLSGAIIDFRVNLVGATISDDTQWDLARATICGHARIFLDDTTIRDNARVNLVGATIRDNAQVNLSRATIRDNAQVNLSRATIRDNAQVNLVGATIRDNAWVDLSSAPVSGQAQVSLFGAKMSGQAQVHLFGAKISGQAQVDLVGATIRDNARVNLVGAMLSDDARMDLDAATISVYAEANLPSGCVEREDREALRICRVHISSGGLIVDDHPGTQAPE